MTMTRRQRGAGDAAVREAGQHRARRGEAGAAMGSGKHGAGSGEVDPKAAGIPVLHCRARLAYWLRAKRRMLRDVREFGDQVSGDIVAIYATSIRYWRQKVNEGGAL